MQGKIKHVCKIKENEEVASSIFRMRLLCPQIAESARAGQFVHVKVAKEPLLRRPFCIHSVEQNHFTILYKVRGTGTKILSEKMRGELLDILGPLGNGFKIKEELKNVLFLCGGVGIAPFPFLASTLKNASITMIYGVRRKEEIVPLSVFKEEVKIIVTTEDGSVGFCGTVLDAFKSMNERFDQIYACGPKEMLFSLASLCKEKLCQVLFEERMGCGVGGCGCCAIKTVDGIKKVCKDGPVFLLHKLQRW